MRGRQIKRVGFFGGVWVIRPPAPQKFSTSSTYLKPSHYDHGFWVSGLFKPCRLTHATCTCFKETALLFNVHLSCLVNFILCPTDKYTFKVNKLVFGNCSSSIYCQNDQFRKSYLLFDTCALINKDMLFKYMLLTCKNFMFSNFTWRKCFCSMKWCGRRWGWAADAPCPPPLPTRSFLLSTVLWTMNICFSSKFASRIPSVLSSFLHAIWLALSSLFPKHFFCCIKMKTYLNHWNSETTW